MRESSWQMHSGGAASAAVAASLQELVACRSGRDGESRASAKYKSKKNSMLPAALSASPWNVKVHSQHKTKHHRIL